MITIFQCLHGILIKMVSVQIKLPLCLTKHHTVKTYWGSGDTVPRILNLDTK
jgi:hypothetical protein